MFRWSVSLAMLEFFQKARTGGREITTQDAVSPIEGIRMDDDLREKAVDIGRLVRHEESQEFLEVLKHQWQAVMLYDATRLVRGKGVATTLEMHVRKRRLFVRSEMDSTWLTTLDQCLDPHSDSSIIPTTNNRCIIQGLNPIIKVNSMQIHSLNT